MNEVHHVFEPWANFYVITGGAAAALTGLMFVVITLVSDGRGARNPTGISAYSTPTVIHFAASLLIAAFANVPWRGLVWPALLFDLIGVGGIVYMSVLVFQVHHLRTTSDYEPDAEDWTWYNILPYVAYGAILAGGIVLPRGDTALFAVGAGVLLLIVIGIHNSWDIVTYIAIGSRTEDDGDGKH